MKKSGFTLIELMIVIAIIIILAGIAVPMFARNRLLAQTAKVLAELDTIRTAANMYHHDTEQWVPVGNSGDGLITNNAGLGGWKGPYMDRWKADPWGTPYEIFDNGTSTTMRWAGSWGPTDSDDNITLLLCPDTSLP
jgi:general secretion pathway protein G